MEITETIRPARRATPKPVLGTKPRFSPEESTGLIVPQSPALDADAEAVAKARAELPNAKKASIVASGGDVVVAAGRSSTEMLVPGEPKDSGERGDLYCTRKILAHAARKPASAASQTLVELAPHVATAVRNGVATSSPDTQIRAARLAIAYQDSFSRLLTAAAPLVAEEASISHAAGPTVQIAIGDVSRLLASRKQANVTEPFLSDVRAAALPPSVDAEQG